MGNLWTRWNASPSTKENSDVTYREKSEGKPIPRCTGYWDKRPELRAAQAPKPCDTCSKRIKIYQARNRQALTDKRDDFRKLSEDYKHHAKRVAEKSQEEYNAYLDKRFVEYSYSAKRHFNRRRIHITYRCPGRKPKPSNITDTEDSSDDAFTNAFEGEVDTPL
jgi:hypothetical protein